MNLEEQAEIDALRSERDRLRSEVATLGWELLALDDTVNLARLRRRVLWTAFVVFLLAPLMFLVAIGLYVVAMARAGG